MTRDQARIVVDHIDLIGHLANGGNLEFDFHNCNGDHVGWEPIRKNLIINCLPRCRKSERVEPKSCCCRCDCCNKKAP